MPDKKILNPSSSGMDIPDAAIERIARVMLPMIQGAARGAENRAYVARSGTRSLSSQARRSQG